MPNSIDESRTIRGARHTTTVVAEPLELVELDEVTRPVAVAIRDAIVTGIKEIPERHGKRHDGRRPFNATGKLVNGVRLEKNSDGTYSIMVPPDRLQNPVVLERLLVLVPVISDPFSSPKIAAALEQTEIVRRGR